MSLCSKYGEDVGFHAAWPPIGCSRASSSKSSLPSTLARARSPSSMEDRERPRAHLRFNVYADCRVKMSRYFIHVIIGAGVTADKVKPLHLRGAIAMSSWQSHFRNHRCTHVESKTRVRLRPPRRRPSSSFSPAHFIKAALIAVRHDDELADLAGEGRLSLFLRLPAEIIIMACSKEAALILPYR